jgi:hypothetical protein
MLSLSRWSITLHPITHPSLEPAVDPGDSDRAEEPARGIDEVEEPERTTSEASHRIESRASLPTRSM